MIRLALSYNQAGGPVSNKIKTQIKFASAPSSATATMCSMKFNKKNTFSPEWDDASVGSITGLSILSAASFTDGCGNNRPYTASVALNGANETSGEEYPYNTGLTIDIMRNQMIPAGWDFSDHGYFHDPIGFGADITPLQSTQKMQFFIKKILDYWTRSKVVPQNYEGHADAAGLVGYLYVTSQGTFDSYTAEWAFAPPGNYANVPAEFAALRRDFTDEWATTLPALKIIIDNLLISTNKFYRLASHTIDATAFQNFITYIQANANDELLVVTTREILEYNEMKTMPVSQSLVGDTLTIETDISLLNTKNRWKDQCFDIVSDKQIISVTTDADSATFNATTGLVNVFKQKNIWD